MSLQRMDDDQAAKARQSVVKSYERQYIENRADEDKNLEKKFIERKEYEKQYIENQAEHEI